MKTSKWLSTAAMFVMVAAAAFAGAGQEQPGAEATGTGEQASGAPQTAPSDPIDAMVWQVWQDATWIPKNAKKPDFEIGSEKTLRLITFDSATNPRPIVKSFNDTMKEIYGVDVELWTTPVRETMSKLAATIAAGDPADWVYDYSLFPRVVARDLIQPVDDYVDYNDPYWHIRTPRFLFDAMTYQGKHWHLIWGSEGQASIWYNSTMFEEAGLDTPLELYRRNEWTWDTFLDAARELTADTDGDGTIDVYGFGMNRNIADFTNTTGKPWITWNDEGISSNLRDPDLARAANFLSDMIHKYEVVFMTVGNPARDAFKAGTVAMLMASAWQGAQWSDKTADRSYELVPMPRDPRADVHYNQALTGGWSMIPKGARNPQAAVAYCALSLDIYGGQYDLWAKDVRERYVELWNYSEPTLRMFWLEVMNPLVVRKIANEFGRFAYNPLGTLQNGLLEGRPWSTLVEEVHPLFEAGIEETLSGE
jgi:ABC-type glycerol-3-phosphate transport system substrate-binding protein